MLLIEKNNVIIMEKQWKEMRGKMEHITLFTDILPEEQERMRVCFHAWEMTFRNGVFKLHEKDRSDPLWQGDTLLL